MRFYSTKNRLKTFSLREAILKSLPEDNGLFMPETIPVLPEAFWKNISSMHFADIAVEVARLYLQDDIDDKDIVELTRDAINFPVPVVELEKDTYVLELFHGPTLAFKDVGARFMARVMALLNKGEKKKLTILVATSGDTGSAVANGFYNVEGIEVIILYPSGKVSPLQEKQLTTLGGNITALEIQGTFDDCQALVKKAFLDKDLKSLYRLSSANSINIARLIPQSFYYIDAYRQLMHLKSPVVFSVPSGNFGDLTAGLLAMQMGMPVAHFVAANNRNNAVCDYLETGEYYPKKTIPTISNAMDVGDPSNFARMLDLYSSDVDAMRKDISAYSFDDDATRNAMRSIYSFSGYTMDPHGAVGYLGWKAYQLSEGKTATGIILETAHPSKFLETVEDTLGNKLTLPTQLSQIADKVKQAHLLRPDYEIFKDFLVNR